MTDWHKGVELFRGGLMTAWRVTAGADLVPRELWELQDKLRDDDFAAMGRDARAFVARFGAVAPCLPRFVEAAGDYGFVVAAPPWLRLAAIAKAGPLPIELVATFVRDLARALAALPPSVALRSLSPNTLAITTDGAPRVLDLTLARFAPREAVTASGVVKGELRFLPPESIRGMIPDAHGDVFALAVIAYQLALGDHPFAARDATDMDFVHAMSRAQLRAGALDRLPPRLAALLHAMLAVDHVDRPWWPEVAAAIDDGVPELVWPPHRVFAEASRLAPDAAREAILYGY
jgi:hypothetical protein|nr:hypothetical protein [Kofleriaceae bacterium]